MPRHRLPAVLPDPAVADHLEILRLLSGRSLRLVQRIGEARPAHGQLAAPAVALRRFRAQRLQHRRQHIRHMVKLMPHPAPLRNALRPMHDQRHPHPAAVRVLLVPLQRRIARLRPAPRIVGRGARTANLVQPPLRLREILRQRLKQPRRVRKALRTALLRRPVVGCQNDQRVRKPPRLFEIGQQPPHLRIGVFQEAGERLLQRAGEGARFRRHLRPGLHAGVARRELRARRNHPQLQLPREPLLADRIPARVELAPVPLDVLRRRLVRRVRRARREIQEERLPRIDRLLVPQKAHRPVRQILRQVISLLRPPGRIHMVIVVDQLRVELIRLAAHKAVEAIEAPLQRPILERTRLRCRLQRRQVPLAHRERRVVLLAQQLRHRRRMLRNRAAHVRVARIEMRNRPHPHRVVVAPRQQRGTRRRAERRHMEIAEAQPACGQPINVRRRNRRAVAAQMREAQIVEQDHQHVRAILRRRAQRRPPRLRLAERAPDPARKPLAIAAGHAPLLSPRSPLPLRLALRLM